MKLTAFVSALILTTGLQAATVIDFSFTGMKETTQMSVMGSGELSFADGLSSVTASQLYTFEYNSTESGSGHSVVLPTVMMSDVKTFDLELTQGVPVFAELVTNYDDVIVNGDFQIGAIFGNAPFSAYQDGATGVVSWDIACTGCAAPGVPIVTAGPVAPEPLSLALCGLGLIGLATASKFRRFGSRHTSSPAL
jgi:hypothetical protein